jgi:hypothetical protein
MTLAECNKVQFLWVPGHNGIEENEIADQLARKGSLHLFIGPEPTCGISGRVSGCDIRDWMCREHQEYWKSTPGKNKQRASTLSPLPKQRLSF